MFYPDYRPRRLRKSEILREMVQETKLSVKDFILPLFVVSGENIKREIESMPGHYQFSVDEIIKEATEIHELNIPAIILFGIPERKDERGSEAYAEKGVIQEAIKAIKSELPDLFVITDVCLCEYTSHGHCGIIKGMDVDNDKTLEALTKMALSHARAGVDMVAPSDMMDGRIGSIRRALDREGFQNIPIMAYSAKYASCFYGPFREAAQSMPQFGDRKSYQMDPANSIEALREVRLDIQEGADIVMVKPALPYLDVIYRIKKEFHYPVAAYNVSGEYCMVKAAAQMGWIDGQKAMMESLLSIKRAGADLIITYFAKEAATLLENS